MVNGLDASSERFLTTLSSIHKRMETAQRQLASGKKINSPSDAPDQIAPLLQARVDLRQMEQMKQNLGRIQGETDAGEQALEQAVQLVERGQALGTQGTGSTQTAATRASIASEVKSLLEQLVGLSQTSMDGRYIFSGDSDQTSPYTLDWTLDPPLSTYQGTPATRQTQHPSGTLFAVSHSADQIFDDADSAKNVFAAMNALRVALEANDVPAITQAVARLRTAGDHLNQELGYYGAVQNQVSQAVNSVYQAELRLKTRLSTMEDADATEAILSMNTAQFQMESALAARAKMPRTSLFDYLG